jgi:magnesium chelatase accessory protein
MNDNIPNWWSNRSASRFVIIHDYKWHFQLIGAGQPSVILIHGTGASTHSWAPLIHELRERCQILAIDLPGHGFSSVPSFGCSTLDAITDGLGHLLKKLDMVPSHIVGHSAGAAIAVQLAARTRINTPVTCINAAFGNFSGMAGIMFPYIAKLAAIAPFSSSFIAQMAQDTTRVGKLMDSTGSKLSNDQLRGYQFLFQRKQHVQGTLQLMADWNLDSFLSKLMLVQNPIKFVTGANDKTVPSTVSQEWAKRITSAEFIKFGGYGHLIHEEAPEIITPLITRGL